ncbi:MAG: HD domain-containing protein [Acidobacteria bacterium]|nr:HD domain-containing protein [Acidobacteriota bacterium]
MKTFLTRFPLRHLVFLIIFLTGIIPLAVSSILLVRQNRDILETQEKSYLTRSAQFLSVELSASLVNARDQLRQLGETMKSLPAEGGIEEQFDSPWLQQRAASFLKAHPDFLVMRVLNRSGSGPQFAAAPVSAEALAALRSVFEDLFESDRPVYQFVSDAGSGRPAAVVALALDSSREYVLEGVVEVRSLASFFLEEAQGDVGVFLIDRDGQVLWSEGSTEEADRAVEGADLVRDFVNLPLNMTREYLLEIGGEEQEMLGRISPVAEPGWGVVVQKPAATAFNAARQMVFQTALSTAVLAVLASLLAVWVSRAISRPIQELTETSHEIAAGNFGKRVEVTGVGSELQQLGSDFNRMSQHVQGYVERLQKAAQANRDLFIGSMRAFVAAIDAKDPYTRGHSERVAAHSRTIAKHLGLDSDMQHRVWVGALLHDVGKIGIEDRILKKGGVLTDDEYEQMKQHPVIGAEIMSRIKQLSEMIPAIRWHHEAWNGAGYPDGLLADKIPLMARIVAVADTFDAITTNRPYQRAYENEFALKRITELAGQRFDAKVVSAFLQAFEAGEVKVRRVATRAPEALPEALVVGG